jgi:predicted transcriptional regulator
MRLEEYLEARGESIPTFAVRAGIKQRNLYNVIEGSNPRIDLCAKIVQASRAEPAPNGSTVRFEDLVPKDSAP